MRGWFKRLLDALTPDVRVAYVKDRQGACEPGRLYVTRSNGEPAHGAMLCPCGCGDTINLRFFGARAPRWSVRRGLFGAATVSPSIWRDVRCRSHFFLRGGRIWWCE